MDVARGPRLEALTGIRIVAAIMVFNAHVVVPDSAPPFVHAFALAGHDWMTMFFVLSGVILVWNYDEVLGDRLSGSGLRTYFVARFARIYPLYLLALALAIGPKIVSLAQLDGLLRLPDFWLHVFALQSWSGDLGVAYGLNGPGWSIGVEFFLYALFPLLLLAFRGVRQNPRALVVIAATAVVIAAALALVLTLTGQADLPHTDPASAHRWIYRTPLTRLPDFVLGIALGYLLKVTATQSLVRIGRWAQAIGAVLVVVPMLVSAYAESVWSLDSMDMAPFGLLLLGLVWAPETVLARLLATKLMVFLGETSFAFYLLHATVIEFVGQPEPGLIPWITTWVTAFVLTAFAAAGAHVLFERPARVWLRKRLDPRRPLPSTLGP
jgi:peptidoglycan/LPS O-acetylase OafA/YrhL